MEDGDFVGLEGAAGMLLETSEGGICMGEGREALSWAGQDPWVLTAFWVDGKSFSILPRIKKVQVIYNLSNDTYTLQRKTIKVI